MSAFEQFNNFRALAKKLEDENWTLQAEIANMKLEMDGVGSDDYENGSDDNENVNDAILKLALDPLSFFVE